MSQCAGESSDLTVLSDSHIHDIVGFVCNSIMWRINDVYMYMINIWTWEIVQ